MDEKRRAWPRGMSKPLRRRRGRLPGSKHAASSSQYALIMMLISFIALMACIAELTYKGKKERVTWQWKGRVPWFYCPRTGKPFCSLWDVIAFASAFLQCVVIAINYSFISRHLNGPIKTSALPIVFALVRLALVYLFSFWAI
ncbi:hypothetical protein QQP08_005796 [Theobroma cacao]|nr:hypothetical protein QQP08_005796 [Theobroma cacao]